MTRLSLPLAFLLVLSCTAGPAKAPPVNVAAEVARIRLLNDSGLAAEARKDIETVMSLVTADILVQLPGAPPLQGKDAVRRFYEDYFRMPIASSAGGSLHTVVAASGDLAYDIGWNRVQMSSPRGTPADSGKYLAIWRKVDGDWRLAVVSASSNGAVKR